MRRYAEIIVDVAHSNVDKIFDYLLPEGMDVSPGSRVFVPFGRTKVEGTVLRIKNQSEVPESKLKVVLSKIDEQPLLTGEQMELAKRVRETYRTTLAFALRLMYPADMRGGRVDKHTVKLVRVKDADKLNEMRSACFTKNGGIRAKNRLKTIDTISEGEVPLAVLDRPSVKKLEESGAAEIIEAESLRAPYKELVAQRYDEVKLTEGQQNAVEKINKLVDSGGRHTALLHGVTGSGKTEVYIRCVRHALEKGKTALILVPEISLAPQLYSTLVSVFGDEIAILHSGLSAGERYDEWRRLRCGRAKIAMGARSAVFAPLENIGLIIIDEEHEQSYRADNHPPYHAADIARIRVYLNSAVLVLASATPLIEDYMKAKMGVYELIEMPERVRGLNLPETKIVDMKREFVKGNRTSISGELYQEIDGILKRGEQALLFLNRRGYSGSVHCPACGHVRKCSHCDIPLKYHKDKNALVCHYCGRMFPFSNICPDCGDPYVRLVGVGTQQLEMQVKELFPQARVLRMDFDTTRRKDAHERIYTQFKNGEADILIGTQMVARGLDFGRVTLAAVISADGMMTQGGYRASEMTFSMIEQVAGRAGRSTAGRVIIQTYNPDDFAVKCAAKHDYAGFFKGELEYRKIALAPPYSKLFRLLFTHKNAEKAEALCLEAENLLKDVLKPYESDIILLTAKNAPVARLDGRSRYHILLRVKTTERSKELKRVLQDVWEELRGRSDVLVSMDIDTYDVN